MGYFPFYIDIENKKCIVAGGGNVALRKIEKLLPFNPCITVIADEICERIHKLPNVKIIKKSFEDSDIEGAFMVISAVDDSRLNEHIYRLCKARNIPVNTVDDAEKCDFIFPALIKTDNITVGISTSGKSPLYARFLRENIEKLLEDDCDRTVDILSKYRDFIKSRIKSEQNRKTAFERILQLCIDCNNNVDEEQIKKITEDLK